MRPALALLALAACAHTSTTSTHWKEWPEGQSPKAAKVYTRNELYIDAPPQVVFAWLAEVQRWPEFYGNAKHIEVVSNGPTLQMDTHFNWETFGHKSESTVRVFEPPRRLAWGADSPSLRAYHTWLLEPEGSGTRVVTEETRVSDDATLDVAAMKAATESAHQQWLMGLSRVATDGPPKMP